MVSLKKKSIKKHFVYKRLKLFILKLVAPILFYWHEICSPNGIVWHPITGQLISKFKTLVTITPFFSNYLLIRFCCPGQNVTNIGKM